MATYLLTNKAVEDLSNIWNYTYEVWSEKQADNYYRMLIECCQTLADEPDSGKNYRDISRDILGYKAGRHIIFYRKAGEDAIEVVRILHSQMDLKSRIVE